MASPLIVLRDATVAHADALPPALHEVSLAVERGDWIAVVGDNGSGKTTLLAALGGALPPRAGRFERADGVRTALLLQEPDNQFVASSVERELALSVPRGTDADTRAARIAAAIERFELRGLLGRNPHRLSGGEKQRLALATVWLEAPDVLLLDEPLSYLDSGTRAHVVAFVRELNARGVAILWATPGGDDVSLARRAVTLVDGRVVKDERGDGAPGAVRHAPAAEDSPALPRGVETEERLVLCLDSVSFAHDATPVFDGIDLEVFAGECVGICGRNGSGKSTLLLVAGGALPPTSGRVTRHAREHGVLYLPQSPERLFFAERVIEEVSYGLERRGITGTAARERARAALEQAALDPDRFEARSPFDLSAGEMRRVAFAIAFALQPDLLLLDEPASGLDRDGVAVLGELVRRAAARGASVLLATHDDAGAIPYHRAVSLDGGAPRRPFPGC